MKTWITCIGQRPFAAINTLWAFLHQNNKEQIAKLSVFYSEGLSENHLTFTMWAEVLCAIYQKSDPKLQNIVYPDNQIKTFRQLLKKQISQSKNKIIMDMTSGRKATSATMLVMGELFPGKVEKVYYNFLENSLYRNCPLPAIPTQACKLYNMMEN